MSSVPVMSINERNRMTNWQIDNVVPYMQSIDSASNRSLFLAAINPNYNVQLIAATLAFKW
jgi:hypothetical protein